MEHTGRGTTPASLRTRLDDVARHLAAGDFSEEDLQTLNGAVADLRSLQNRLQGELDAAEQRTRHPR